MKKSSITEIIDDIRDGKMVIILDDESRENEGDLVCAAEAVTPEIINFMASKGKGLICLPMSKRLCDKFDLQMMTNKNRAANKTAFTVSIEAAEGITTGISAADRAHTIKTAVRKDSKASDIVQPGHIFPLKAMKGGVLSRAGHTEAACDLAKLAGFQSAGVICEIMNDDGTMARRDDLLKFGNENSIKVGTIADLIDYRLSMDATIESVLDKDIENEFGKFKFAADNEPRFDHDPDTRECKGLLIEESRTNIATYSNDYSQFGGYNVTKTANNAVAPDGTTTAAKIEHGGSGTSYLDKIYNNF